MANLPICDIVACEFEFELRNYIHFRTNTYQKGINSFILQGMRKVVSILYFNKDGFAIN